MLLTTIIKSIILSMCIVVSFGFLAKPLPTSDTNMADVLKDLTSLRTLLLTTNQKVFSLEREISAIKQELLQCKTDSQGLQRNQTRLSTEVKHCIDQCKSSPLATTNSADFLGHHGGEPFDDKSIWRGQNITALRLLCGSNFESLQIRYGNQWGPVHGHDDNNCITDGKIVEYDLAQTEYIQSIEARFRNWMDSITFTTNMRTLLRCGGDGGGDSKTVSGSRLMYISGSAGCYVDGIYPHWAVV